MAAYVINTTTNSGGNYTTSRYVTSKFFLDAVAAHVSNDASWLPDTRFRGLLRGDEDLVGAAPSLYPRAAEAGPECQGLADVLLSFGAASGEYDEEIEGRRWRAGLPS